MKIPSDVIEEARQLIKDGVSVRGAIIYLGLPLSVMYHLYPGRKESHKKLVALWQKNNPEKKKTASRKASKKYAQTHVVEIRESNMKSWRKAYYDPLTRPKMLEENRLRQRKYRTNRKLTLPD